MVPGAELLRAHVLRIEAGAFGPLAVARKEGLAVNAVPGAVVDFGIDFFCGIPKRAQEGIPVTEVLLPVDFVHLVGSLPVEAQDLLSVVGDAGQVRSRDAYLGIVFHEPAHIGPLLRTGKGEQPGEQKQSGVFSHVGQF